MNQRTLFDVPSSHDGPDLTQHDQIRLDTAQGRVTALMSDGNWRTLPEIASAVGCSESGASARLRDMRKAKFGGHKVERERVSGGVWKYRVVI